MTDQRYDGKFLDALGEIDKRPDAGHLRMTYGCICCGKTAAECDELAKCPNSFPRREARRWGVPDPVPSIAELIYKDINNAVTKVMEGCSIDTATGEQLDTLSQYFATAIIEHLPKDE